jgi:hypothetical protein
MFHKLIAVAAWALLAFIAYATISPIQDRPTLPTSSSFERLAVFAVLGALFCLVYPRRIALVCLIVLGSAMALELVQLLTPDRHGRISDAVEKIAGGAAGVVAGRAILHLERANRRFQYQAAARTSILTSKSRSEPQRASPKHPPFAAS